jgi:transposase
MIPDNDQFHKAKKLSVPSNVGLTFLPPYSPELNLIERLWQDPLASWLSISILQALIEPAARDVGRPFVITPTRGSLP